jgi:putative PIN family toxin of toxin-antitoxin system
VDPPTGFPRLKVVLDTNVLVGAAYAPHSASRRVVEACLRGELAVVISTALKGEYEHILPRAVKVPGFAEALRELLRFAVIVEPAQTPRVVADDPDDDKVLAAAVAGQVDALVTNDHHLLALDPYGSIHVLRPAAFLTVWGQRFRHGDGD